MYQAHVLLQLLCHTPSCSRIPAPQRLVDQLLIFCDICLSRFDFRLQLWVVLQPCFRNFGVGSGHVAALGSVSEPPLTRFGM
jgi:hypothetical protein